ncbi:MAG: hypothetical protein ACRDL7_04505 [Gaiellaceae bacterium]
MFRTIGLGLAALILAALAGAADLHTAAAAAAPVGGSGSPADRATFEIKVHDKTIGTETIEIENTTDSLRVSSSSLQLLGSAGRDSLIKQTRLVATIEDLDMHAYASAQRFLGQVIERGVECEDTLVHLSTFADGRGEQDIVSRPPGRLFVIDAGSFVSFDLICRMLHGRAFLTRPVNMLVLGPRDTVVIATLEDRGTETLRWGTAPTTARRVELTDRSSRYTMWMDVQGRMLRLDNAWSGVRVERRPPPARSAPKKSSGS